ncbi:hypothetical protein HYALB_00007699 [Hymenoscyphus albidus]|uniref:TauD/TfdA-like domain-containing protein n=1 Tax=Hymenoscyphus albidus TaxID=595503 RepID=A0A9N9LK04_9HELO|nr:hypothetical protein HYALB_00007699 [Hymenoscyphus albidus]
MVIFLGIQSFIAETRARQDEKGNMIGGYKHTKVSSNLIAFIVHILTDDTVPLNPMKEYHTRHSKSPIPFHTDEFGDILAFQTRSAAIRGGNCILSPVYTIYNELVVSRPDVIWTLSEPDWPLHLPHYHQRALLFYEDSHIIFNAAPNALLGSKAHPRPTTIPSISPRQLEALTLVQGLAEKHKISFSAQKGDMHFFNNLALVHRRDATEVGPGGKRHLVRMYLRNEGMAWKIPMMLNTTTGWEEAYRQGEDVEQVWHIEPMPDVFLPLIRKPN